MQSRLTWTQFIQGDHSTRATASVACKAFKGGFFFISLLHEQLPAAGFKVLYSYFKKTSTHGIILSRYS